MTGGAGATGGGRAGASGAGARAAGARGAGAKRARLSGRAYEQGARNRLRRFRQGSALAVAITGMILLLWGVGPEDIGAEGVLDDAGVEAPQAPQDAQDAQAPQDAQRPDDPDAAVQVEEPPPPDPTRAVEEATRTIRDLALGFYGFLPKLVIALTLLVIAAFLSRLLNRLFRKLPGRWERSEALGATAGILVWLMAIGAALSVIAGDARALLGSVGLLGLALSWALQAPIESFAGWVLNSFRSYYRVGDRIAVGEVFGDVYRIDFLTTTVWQAGGPDKPVRGAQPTGASVTFPNSEVLRTNLINYTRDFPYVWDEITLQVGQESDLDYAVEVLQAVAARVVGEPMVQPARLYVSLLRRERLEHDVSTDPQVFVSDDESWTNLTVRYLIPSRERRLWSTRLTLAAMRELNLPEHQDRIHPGRPRLGIEVAGNGAAEGTAEAAQE